MSRGRIQKALSGFYYVDNGAEILTCHGGQQGGAAEQGGLTGTGGADDRHHLAFFHGETDILQDVQGAVKGLFNVLEFHNIHELVNEDLQSKLKRMPDDARRKLQETLTRIINEGSGGLICIIL